METCFTFLSSEQVSKEKQIVYFYHKEYSSCVVFVALGERDDTWSPDGR